MSNKRGSRGSKCKRGIVVMGDIVNPRSSTLDLLNTVGVKPCINDIIGNIISRMDSISYGDYLGGLGWSDSMLYDCMGENDYLTDDYDDYLSLYKSKRLKRINKKLYNNHYRGKVNKKSHSAKYYDDEDDDYWSNRHTMYSDDEWDDSMSDEYYENPGGYKSIKFYSDIENELSCIEFSSLKEFNDYCDENGYVIGDTDLSNLKNWSVIHCCLDPIDKEYGDNVIITDSSYGGLYWTVSDDITKKGVVSSKSSSEIF